MKNFLFAVLVCSIASVSVASCKKDKEAVDCSSALKKVEIAFRAYKAVSNAENCSALEKEWTNFAKTDCFLTMDNYVKFSMQHDISIMGKCSEK